MHEVKIITLSDSDFYKKVINKYQKGKRNPFRFPMMIFYKHAGRVLSQKINIDILLQPYFHDRNIFSSLVVKSVQNMKRLFSWFMTEKRIPQFITKPALLKRIHSANKIFTLIQHETASRLLRAAQMAVNSLSFVRARPETPGGYGRVSKSETSSFSQGQGNQEIVQRLTLGTLHRQPRRLMQRLRRWKVLQPLFSIPNTILYLHDVTGVSAPCFTVNRQFFNQFFNQGNYVQIIKPETEKRRTFPVRGIDGRYPSSQKENIGGYPPVLEHKSPAILPQVSCLQNKSSNETFQNWTTVNKPLIKHYHYKFGSNAVNSIAAQIKTTFEAGNEDFYFNKAQTMSREVEELRKIIVETKETVIDKSVSTHSPIEIDMKKYLDVNRLSDQVYQKIEQRIRIERERRGL
ncbi:MAG: hypothetical protein LWX55_00755 [Deltaproteobacteria bacterium]|nr:hypothetical protein [Deltaproteobacteria bacterium]